MGKDSHDPVAYGYPPVTICRKCGRVLIYPGANDPERTTVGAKACDGGA